MHRAGPMAIEAPSFKREQLGKFKRNHGRENATDPTPVPAL